MRKYQPDVEKVPNDDSCAYNCPLELTVWLLISIFLTVLIWFSKSYMTMTRISWVQRLNNPDIINFYFDLSRAKENSKLLCTGWISQWSWFSFSNICTVFPSCEDMFRGLSDRCFPYERRVIWCWWQVPSESRRRRIVAQRSFPGSKHIAQRLRRHVTSRGVSNSRRGRRLPRDPAAPRPHDASPAELAATTRRTQRRRVELSHLQWRSQGQFDPGALFTAKMEASILYMVRFSDLLRK